VVVGYRQNSATVSPLGALAPRRIAFPTLMIVISHVVVAATIYGAS
jgi:hypothetical protein